MADFPPSVFKNWDGAVLRAAGLAPVLRGVALSNAYPRCPTRDGLRFHAPSDAELRSRENLDRVEAELRRAHRPGAPLQVLALGRRAGWLLAQLQEAFAFSLEVLPHPSAQGLLQAAPGKGKGMKLQDLRQAWEEYLLALLGAPLHKI